MNVIFEASSAWNVFGYGFKKRSRATDENWVNGLIKKKKNVVQDVKWMVLTCLTKQNVTASVMLHVFVMLCFGCLLLGVCGAY